MRKQPMYLPEFELKETLRKGTRIFKGCKNDLDSTKKHKRESAKSKMKRAGFSIEEIRELKH
jgi:hypothetical protein